ncbi:hypothetical protein PIB30_055783 [Stylosanthes scabra]|uniref:Uncharacterized protein n=1 Tax=Stylosanthes scabra TaxID=79078 RepID=A0ABU6YHY6_9FABA|nr:hypothetical protein [Stylosanthes scabra]
MLRSHSDPGLLLFDPKIERTLRRARQARCRAELARLGSDNNPFDWSNSDSDTRTTSSDIGTLTMGERLTLKQIRGASTAFDNLPNRVPELNANFKLKSGLINLLPKFCGRSGEDPIKHIKDFEVIYTTQELLSFMRKLCMTTYKAMIDTSSGGALMNKTPKEAWELIETVADAN